MNRSDVQALITALHGIRLELRAGMFASLGYKEEAEVLMKQADEIALTSGQLVGIVYKVRTPI